MPQSGAQSLAYSPWPVALACSFSIAIAKSRSRGGEREVRPAPVSIIMASRAVANRRSWATQRPRGRWLLCASTRPPSTSIDHQRRLGHHPMSWERQRPMGRWLSCASTPSRCAPITPLHRWAHRPMETSKCSCQSLLVVGLLSIHRWLRTGARGVQIFGRTLRIQSRRAVKKAKHIPGGNAQATSRRR